MRRERLSGHTFTEIERRAFEMLLHRIAHCPLKTRVEQRGDERLARSDSPVEFRRAMGGGIIHSTGGSGPAAWVITGVATGGWSGKSAYIAPVNSSNAAKAATSMSSRFVSAGKSNFGFFILSG